MNITTRDEGLVTVIVLQGKIMSETDISEFMDTMKDVMGNGRERVAVDMTDVDWINSSGLGMFIAAQGLLKEINGQFRLFALSNSVEKVINMNRLNLVLNIHPTAESAISSLI